MAEGTEERNLPNTPPGPSMRRKGRVLTALAFILLTAAAVGCGVLAVSEWRDAEAARKGEQEAAKKQEKAEEAAAEFKGKFQQKEAEWKTALSELHQLQASAAAARRSSEDTKAVLDFLKQKLLSAGRPGDASLTEAFWAGGLGKDLTLLKAVEMAGSQVAESFADRPLGEVSVREMLGLTLLNLGQPAKAVKQYERALALREAMQGVEHPDTAACRNQLAVAYRLAGRITEAGRLFDRSSSSPAHAAALAVRGQMLLLQKKPVEAELKLRECLTIRQKTQPDDWSTFDTKSMLGEALLEQKKYAEAEPLLLSGYQGMKQRENSISMRDRLRLTEGIQRLVKLYEAWGKQDQATKWRKELNPAGVVRKS